MTHEPARGDDERGGEEGAAVQVEDLARFLDRSLFPADRSMILAMAVRAGAPPAVIERLHTLPDGVLFATAEAVIGALGGGSPRAALDDDEHTSGTATSSR